MSNFKKVLETEKKYEHTINTAQKKIEIEKEKFNSDLKLKEEVIKQDYKNELESDYKKQLENYKLKAEKIILNAKNESDYLKENANLEKAKEILIGEIKNV